MFSSGIFGQQPNGGVQAVPSVFDTYSRGIRGNLIGATDAVGSISACDSLMQTSTILSYVISVTVIVLLILVAFNFNYVLIVVLMAIVTIISIYQSIIMSNKNCNGLFGGWFSG